ncbi:hypothetical protein SAMN05421692_1327 [Chryseobacterium indologenes]|nr:hypothetical protein SAMN05421692_1327 [Chryseobacterium indologenes]SUX49083.1 Uncharacterised protein [Chryseobacterium indologenes]VFA40028.1 Uncharacterised protein [Chryseobacterium indologenes]
MFLHSSLFRYKIDSAFYDVMKNFTPTYFYLETIKIIFARL